MGTQKSHLAVAFLSIIGFWFILGQGITCCVLLRFQVHHLRVRLFP